MPPIREYPLNRCDEFLAKCKAHRKAIKIFATGDSWLAAPGGWWRGASVVNRLNNDDWVHSIDPAHPGFNILSIAKVGFEVDRMPTDRDLLALDYVRNEFDRQNIPGAGKRCILVEQLDLASRPRRRLVQRRDKP